MGLKGSVVLIVLLATSLSACNEDNTFGLNPSGNTDRFGASLSGAGVRPIPVATTATATADVSVKQPAIGSNQRTLSFVISIANLTSASAAHIHLGGSSVSNGPTLVTLYTNPTDSAITATQLVNGAIAENSLGAVSLDSLATLMRVGAAYIDIHTLANPLGLIRGQLVKSGQQAPGDVFAAPLLTGAKERPTPVVSTATGSATFEQLNASTIRFNLAVSGLSGAMMAHIHTGVVDSAGPIAVTLFTSATPTGPLTGTLASGSFTSTNIQLAGVSLDSLLTLMRRGRTYVNVHTLLNPSGEIRAQIDPVSVLPK